MNMKALDQLLIKMLPFSWKVDKLISCLSSSKYSQVIIKIFNNKVELHT